MKKLLLIGTILGATVLVNAQTTLTLDTCYARARQQYPLIKQKGLIEKTKEFSVANAAKGYLPQVNFNGQATYQSAVTSITISGLPPAFKGLSFPTPTKDQFNMHGEVDQTIYDGGTIKQQKQSQEVNAGIQDQNIEVQLYALKDRINQIFFGALLIDEQLKQNEVTQKDLQNSIDQMQAAVNNGTALNSSLEELQAELYQQQQNSIGLTASRKAYVDMLAIFINEQLDENTVFATPRNLAVSDSIHRPELSFYDFQKKNDDVQDKLLNAGNRPKFSAFFQGGYALPGLNGFDVNPAWYYITGVRLTWSLGGFYTLKNQRQLLEIDRQSLDVQKDDFIFNTRINLRQESADMIKLQQMINKDNDIISKRTAVKDASKAQMDNGVITVHDYISQLDAEDAAKQNLLLHQVQLLMDQYNYQNTSGN
ncbi:MAG TPA: TolC family protein [Bacteroidia bacterium]|jgi:outer membrane protein TolC|nr:TolC family protein [Bacteroidia bacterium]